MSLASLRKHLSALKLELLDDGEEGGDGPVVHGRVQTPSKTPKNSTTAGVVFRSPISTPADVDQPAPISDSTDEVVALRRQLADARRELDDCASEIATLRQTTKSAPYLVAHAEALAVR